LVEYIHEVRVAFKETSGKPISATGSGSTFLEIVPIVRGERTSVFDIRIDAGLEHLGWVIGGVVWNVM